MSYQIDPYEPCPCGSGKKYKFCCAAAARQYRHGKYPIGTVAFYGPDDKTTTKIAAGVFLHDGAEPIMERFVGTDVAQDPKVHEQIRRFFARYGVKSVGMTQGNLGCPHEEGEDYPLGDDCPFCPFWAGKQGSTRFNAEDEHDGGDPDGPDDEHEGYRLVTLSDADSVDEAEDDDEEDEERDERDLDALYARIAAILGDGEMDRDQELEIFLAHLRAHLTFPCEVTGIEDFQWEEPYVFGGWSVREYRKLKKTQPSYEDRYQLLSIGRDWSEWMMCNDDLSAHVRRVSDGKEFILGLSELEATDRNSSHYQLLDDYSVWFMNSR